MLKPVTCFESQIWRFVSSKCSLGDKEPDDVQKSGSVFLLLLIVRLISSLSQVGRHSVCKLCKPCGHFSSSTHRLNPKKKETMRQDTVASQVCPLFQVLLIDLIQISHSPRFVKHIHVLIIGPTAAIIAKRFGRSSFGLRAFSVLCGRYGQTIRTFRTFASSLQTVKRTLEAKGCSFNPFLLSKRSLSKLWL